MICLPSSVAQPCIMDENASHSGLRGAVAGSLCSSERTPKQHTAKENGCAKGYRSSDGRHKRSNEERLHNVTDV